MQKTFQLLQCTVLKLVPLHVLEHFNPEYQGYPIKPVSKIKWKKKKKIVNFSPNVSFLLI